MIATGLMMLLVSWLGCYYLFRKKEAPSLFYKILVLMSFSGWIATIAGWYVTEIGRQPYLVQGVLKTADAVTTVPSAYIAISLTIYLLVYILLIIAFATTLFYMARKSKDKEFDPNEFDPTTGQRRSISTVNIPLKQL